MIEIKDCPTHSNSSLSQYNIIVSKAINLVKVILLGICDKTVVKRSFKAIYEDNLHIKII